MEIAIPLTGKVNVKDVNRDLLRLPAKTYLGLFREMHKSIYGYPPMNCCGCVGSLGDETDNYSEQLKKSEHNGDSPLTDFTEFPRDHLQKGE